jgi:hypothetical protein
MGNLSTFFPAPTSSNVLEYLQYYADGRTVETTKGNIAVQNVTSELNLSTTWTDFTGSVIEYTPPDGTKCLHYQLHFKGYHIDANNITHFQAYLDDASGTATAITESRCTKYANANYDNFYTVMTTFKVGESSESIAAANVGTWDSPRTLKYMVREYNSSYEYVLNKGYHWNGGGSTVTLQPLITIMATK